MSIYTINFHILAEEQKLIFTGNYTSKVAFKRCGCCMIICFREKNLKQTLCFQRGKSHEAWEYHVTILICVLRSSLAWGWHGLVSLPDHPLCIHCWTKMQKQKYLNVFETKILLTNIVLFSLLNKTGNNSYHTNLVCGRSWVMGRSPWPYIRGREGEVARRAQASLTPPSPSSS